MERAAIYQIAKNCHKSVGMIEKYYAVHINIFTRHSCHQCRPIGNGDRRGIPEEWEDEQPEGFKKAVETIHAAADKVCSSYDKLVRTARKKFLP
jgi:hypothetical protein